MTEPTTIARADELLWELHHRFIAKTGHAAGSVEDQRFLAIAFGGETGEVLNLMKKEWREGSTPERRAALRVELGDALSYWLLLVRSLGHSPDEVVAEAVAKAAAKIEELEARR